MGSNRQLDSTFSLFFFLSFKIACVIAALAAAFPLFWKNVGFG